MASFFLAFFGALLVTIILYLIINRIVSREFEEKIKIIEREFKLQEDRCRSLSDGIDSNYRRSGDALFDCGPRLEKWEKLLEYLGIEWQEETKQAGFKLIKKSKKK